MDITYLGGVEEVGRSCIVVTVNGKSIMLDCGIRASAEGAGRYPNFDKIPTGTDIDAIIISHAHMDHAGPCPWQPRSTLRQRFT